MGNNTKIKTYEVRRKLNNGRIIGVMVTDHLEEARNFKAGFKTFIVEINEKEIK